MKIGDRVEAGWLGHDIDGYTGPKGSVVGVDGSHFVVRWDNGYQAAFPRVELRLRSPEARHFKHRTVALEDLDGTMCQETP